MITIKVMTENQACCGIPGMITNKKWRAAENRAHTSLIILPIT